MATPFCVARSMAGIQGFVYVTQPGARDHNPLVAVIDEGIDDIALHVGVVVNQSYFFFKIGENIDLPILAAAVVIAAQRGDLFPADHGDGNIADGAKSGAVRGMHLAHTSSPVQEAEYSSEVGPNMQTTELGDVRFSRCLVSVDQVERRIRRWAVGGTLGAHQDNGNGANSAP